MNWVDIIIVLIVGLFVLVGVLRGFISEVLSFLTWVLSFLVAWFFSGDFTGWFAGHLKDANLRTVVVFFLLFFASNVCGQPMGHVKGHLLKVPHEQRVMPAGIIGERRETGEQHHEDHDQRPLQKTNGAPQKPVGGLRADLEPSGANEVGYDRQDHEGREKQQKEHHHGP